MDMTLQGRKAEELRKLHGGPRVLVLPNAWDVASARVLEELGYPAIATTSAGVAFALGYPDGQRISRDEMLEVVARIARAVRVPVTADMEAGYGITPKDMAETAKAILAAGAVGLNLEDVTGDTEASHVDIALQAEKILEKLVKAVAAPLNILVTPGCPSIPELEKFGVRRVSIGSGVMRSALGLVRRIGRELLEKGTYSSVFEGAIPFAEVNALLARSASAAKTAARR